MYEFTTRIRDIPPMRPDAWQGDERDTLRAEYVKRLFHSQDEMLRARDRQVEENLRMLQGEQWMVWSEIRGRYVNISNYISDDERRWRHYPVSNFIAKWFRLQHARMTESPPVIGWSSGPDQADRDLAEIMDSVWSHFWDEIGMPNRMATALSWLIPCGTVYLKSRLDPSGGETVQRTGPAMLTLDRGEQGTVERYAEDVPFDDEWNPLAELVEDEGGEVYWQPTGDPTLEQTGSLTVEVIVPTDVRSEWDPRTQWQDRRWHIQRSFVTPETAFELTGRELEPDVTGAAADEVGALHTLMQGGGSYGGASASDSAHLESMQNVGEWVTLYEMWHRPSRLIQGTEKGPGQPGGRLTIVTGAGDVIRDGPRYAPFRHTSPIHQIRFVDIPGRPEGSSPQENLNGPQRTFNRLKGQIIGHATLVANPIQIVDMRSGLQEGSVKNLPGQQVWVNRVDNVPVIEYSRPPEMNQTVFKAHDTLYQEIEELGDVRGTGGAPPTPDPSGELVKELRWNSDRLIGTTMRHVVTTLGYIGEDWKALIPIAYPREKIIRIAGSDNIARTVTLYPEIFEQGNVNAKPSIDSMLPESRGERRERAKEMWMAGVWGDPAGLEARMQYLDEARFPHMNRATRPGGPDRSTAEQNVGALLEGTPAIEIPIFPWYDHALHRFVLERFMKAPEYKKTSPEVQQECVTFWQMLIMAQARAQQMFAGLEAQNAVAIGSQQVAAQGQIQNAAMDAGVMPAEGNPAQPAGPPRGTQGAAAA